MQEQEKIETKEENKAKVENAKREYYAKTLKNKRIVRALKGCVYAVTTVMLALGLLTFIVVFCLDKHWINSNITIPIIVQHATKSGRSVSTSVLLNCWVSLKNE